VVENTCINK